MNGKKLAWLVMVVLSLAVSAYAIALLIAPDIRPQFVQAMFEERPISTSLHFSGSALALATGVLQFYTRLRARFIGAHRWSGRIYLLGVAIGGLSGLLLGFQASGGTVARCGFILLAVLWLGFTLTGYLQIRAGNTNTHRRWMIRSFALTFGAVTLRIYLPASLIAEIPFNAAYPVIAWIAWVPNLVVAECLIRLGPRGETDKKLQPIPRPGAA